MNNYFELFGIPESLRPDAGAVRRKWQELSRVFHPDRYTNATGSEQIVALQRSSEINEGYKTLSDPMRTLRHVLEVHNSFHEEGAKLPQEFLMEIMELNEAVGNASMAPDMAHEAVREYDLASSAWAAAMDGLIARFEAGERSPELFGALADYYFRKKYLLRLKERLA